MKRPGPEQQALRRLASTETTRLIRDGEMGGGGMEVGKGGGLLLLLFIVFI